MSPMRLFSHRLRFKVVGIGVNQNEPGNLVHVEVCKRAHIVASEGGPHQDVGPADAGMVKRSAQLLSDMHTAPRHRPRFAESGAGTVIAAGARPFGDLWLHLRPRWRPVSPESKTTVGEPLPMQ